MPHALSNGNQAACIKCIRRGGTLARKIGKLWCWNFHKQVHMFAVTNDIVWREKISLFARVIFTARGKSELNQHLGANQHLGRSERHLSNHRGSFQMSIFALALQYKNTSESGGREARRWIAFQHPVSPQCAIQILGSEQVSLSPNAIYGEQLDARFH